MNPLLPREARIVERTEEALDIFTLGLQFPDMADKDHYRFAPGQFNMLYLHGVGEIPISIVSDPEDKHILYHTIRRVGRVTKGMHQLKVGDYLGIRGPYGRGWPVDQAKGKTVFVVTGGLGCAPVMSVINYILKRRDEYGRLVILQGVKHSNDLIWRAQYHLWSQLPNVTVHLAADVAERGWPGTEGPVTHLIDETEIDADAAAFICGPEAMMVASARQLVSRGLQARRIWLSLERNMQCATGHCGHCQLGPRFVCGEGPVFPWPIMEPLLSVRNL